MVDNQPTEHAEQVAFVSRCRREGITVIMIENSLQFDTNGISLELVKKANEKIRFSNIIFSWLIAQFKKILNIRLKRLTDKRIEAGQQEGAPDLFLPAFKLFIEMKRRDGGVVSESQKKVHKMLRGLDYKVEVCNGAAVAWAVVEKERDKK